MGDTKIQWTNKVWNPVRGCSRITPGCGGPNHQGGCYAEKIAARFSDPGQAFHGFADRRNGVARWTGKVALIPEMLDLPLHWRKPSRIFVNSMSDLFHEALADADIDQVFGTIALTPQHTHQILTKRSPRMALYLTDPATPGRVWAAASERHSILWALAQHGAVWGGETPWPLRNAWIGSSVEDQQRADERRESMAAISTAGWTTFVSYEPALGPVDWTGWEFLDQLIVGGESGPNPREFRLSWARDAIRWCSDNDVACFVKQLGTNAWNDISYIGSTPRFETRDRKGGNIEEWPAALRVRQFPEPKPNTSDTPEQGAHFFRRARLEDNP